MRVFIPGFLLYANFSLNMELCLIEISYGSFFGGDLGRILVSIPNLLNSENGRLSKTDSRSSKEYEF